MLPILFAAVSQVCTQFMQMQMKGAQPHGPKAHNGPIGPTISPVGPTVNPIGPAGPKGDRGRRGKKVKSSN